MDKFNFSIKHVAINKANAQIVMIVGAASFITVFCLVASKAVLSQYQYQARVTKAVSTANQQLQSNISAYKNLVYSYVQFDTTNPIKLGNFGTTTAGNNDNVQIILDALPGQYDFPGLTSTVENILKQSGVQISAVTGTDNQVSQQTANASSSPQPVSMPFGFTVQNASYSSIQQLIQVLQQSIRPLPIDSINLTAAQGSLTMTVAAHSYYQPSKTLSITKETVN
ncbi:MAG TPA: hypothetical protein VNG32_01280 [Candidatus Dormibacteraeota bacterium]|nr:hypothetical protein [Candidatus Dormibacteraeota bacterium]